MSSENKQKHLFVEKIRNNKLQPPTKFKFSLQKWNQEWEKVKNEATERDLKVYKAGLMINSMLGEIRAELDSLYTKAPKITFEKLMRLYVAYSNRDVVVALKHAIKACN